MHKNLSHIVDSLFNEDIQQHTLDNGLKVFIKEDHSLPLASVQAWVKTGSIHEAEWMGSGVSHYVEHMLFKGTEKRHYKAISDDVQEVGGNINAYTTFDRTVYHIDLPSAHVDTSLDVLSDILFNSQFNPEETHKEQDVILREIDMDLDDPDYNLSRALFASAFKKHPYQHPVIGHRPLFQDLSRDDLYAYYKQRYVPNNMVLIVVGDVDPDVLLDRIKDHFGSHLPSALAPVFVPEEPIQNSRRVVTEYADVNILRGCIAYRIPGLGHADNPALAILANLLGHGQSSHLWQTLREEQRVVESISASVWNPGTSGLFFINYISDPKNAQVLPKLIEQEIHNFFKKKINAKRLQRVIRQAIMGEIHVRKTVTGQASQVGVAEVVIGDLSFPKTFLKKLQAVTPDQLVKVYNKYFTDHNQIQGQLLPKAFQYKKAKTARGPQEVPDFEHIRLPNGAQLLLQPYSKVPNVLFSATFRGGPFFETSENAGITGILASLLSKDTKKRKSAKIAEIIDTIGGSFSEFAGNNSLGLCLEVLNSDFDLAADLLEQAIVYPAFTQNNLDIERQGQIAQIKRSDDEILDHGFRILREKFFPDHSFRFDALGTLQSLDWITLKDVKVFYDRLITGPNTVLTLTGNFDPSHAKKVLTKILSKLPSRPLPEIDLNFNNFFTLDTQKPLEKEQVVVLEAYPSYGVLDPNFETAEVLDEILSGMSSQLFDEVREKQGLAYYVGATRVLSLKTGMFIFYAGTSKENYHKVYDAFTAEIERIRSGNINVQELERCKTRLKSEFIFGLQSLRDRAFKAGLDTLYGLPTNGWRNFPERIEAVTPDTLKAFANECLKPEYRHRMSIGDI